MWLSHLVHTRTLGSECKGCVSVCVCVCVCVTRVWPRAISFTIMHVPSADLSVERSSPSACFPYRRLVTFDLARSHAIWYFDRRRFAPTTIFSSRFRKIELERHEFTSASLLSTNVYLMMLEYFLISGLFSGYALDAIRHVGENCRAQKKETVTCCWFAFVRYIATRFDEAKGLRRRRLAEGMKPDLGLRSRNLPGDRPNWPLRTRFAFQCPSECDPHPATTPRVSADSADHSVSHVQHPRVPGRQQVRLFTNIAFEMRPEY